MSFSVADARFLADRALGMIRRGLSSLRTRGWRATWKRVTATIGMFPPPQREPFFFPVDGPFVPFAVPASDAPCASIVIPVYNQCEYTLGCLHALAAHPPTVPCEIIVVDDGSEDATAATLALITGLRYHRRSENGGFIAACNDGAALARGKFLVFLNNDTVPQPGWLDALVHTFDQHPNVGLVGAQLLYPDGRLQEAGAMVAADGRAESLGRFEDPEHPAFRFARDVDYCSGAAIAIPRALFTTLEGFDRRFAPAYYEDTDLAFRVRRAGHRVLYQPTARVIHIEGATAGTDPARGVKANQSRNRAVFAERWAAELEARRDPSSPGGDRSRQVLVVDAMTPTPDHDSGSLRLFNLMRLLVEEGARVVFLPADRRHAGRYTRALQTSGVEAWYAPQAGRIPAWLRKHGSRFDLAIVSRHYVAGEWLPLLRRYAPQARVVFDAVDLHYLRERRGADLAGDAGLLRAAARTRRHELDVIARSDVTLVVSEPERALLAVDAPGADVRVLSNLHQVAGPGLPFAQRSDLVFVGGFRHPPNVDAVLWFVQAVFPLVRTRLPQLRFHCIGGDVPDAIAALDAIPGVTVHGHVPDIQPYMDGCLAAVAPLRFGAGVKGKVNLSMAHGQPVVATLCAVEGMHLHDDIDVLVADSAIGFADAIMRLHADPVLWQRLSGNGLDNVARHFSLDAGRAVLRGLLASTGQHGKTP